MGVHRYEVSLLTDGSLTKSMLRPSLLGAVKVNKERAYSLDSKAIVQCGLPVLIRFVAGVQPRLIQGIRSGDGVGDLFNYLFIKDIKSNRIRIAQ